MLRFLILALSLGSGALATTFMLNYNDVGGAVASVSEPMRDSPMKDVLVAGYDLTHGDVLAAGSLHWQSWPESAVSSAFLVREERPEATTDFEGKYVRGGFSAGEPIRMERLAHKNARLLSTNLPAGHRAVALRVSAESTAGGFVLPNDRVDVLLTATEVSEGGSKAASRVIARNVLVLAIDQLSGSTESDPVIGSTATLELAEWQVEVVLAAAASGMLSLALRSSADQHLVEAEPEPEPEFVASRLVPDPPASAPVTAALPRTIRVRRGIEVETVVLQ